MRAYGGHWKGKNFVSKIHCYCPWFLKRWITFSLSNLRAEYNWRAISRTLPSNLKLPWIYEEIFNLSNLRAEYPQILILITCKIYLLMPTNFDEKMPLDYDWFCPLKMMAFMIIKGNIICWHFLKALPSADNFHCILRAITANFWDKVFSLRFWGHFIQQWRLQKLFPLTFEYLRYVLYFFQ